MQALPIVEDFDVLEHCRPRFLAGAELDLMDVLRLERGEGHCQVEDFWLERGGWVKLAA